MCFIIFWQGTFCRAWEYVFIKTNWNNLARCATLSPLQSIGPPLIFLYLTAVEEPTDQSYDCSIWFIDPSATDRPPSFHPGSSLPPTPNGISRPIFRRRDRFWTNLALAVIGPGPGSFLSSPRGIISPSDSQTNIQADKNKIHLNLKTSHYLKCFCNSLYS